MTVDESTKGSMIAFMILYGMYSTIYPLDVMSAVQRMIQYTTLGIPTLIIFILRIILVSIPTVWIGSLLVAFHLFSYAFLSILYHSSMHLPTAWKMLQDINYYVKVGPAKQGSICDDCERSEGFIIDTIKWCILFAFHHMFELTLLYVLTYAMIDYWYH